MKRILTVLCIMLLLLPIINYSQNSQYSTGPNTQVQDSLAAKAKSDSLLATTQYKVIKKDVVVSDQVKIGAAIMTFVIVVMSFFKNFNPD